MKFCRNCGTSLANATGVNPSFQPAPAGFANVPAPAGLAALTPNFQAGDAPPLPTLPPDPGFLRPQAQSTSLPPGAPTMMAPVPANAAAAMPSAIAGTPLAAVAPVPLPYGQEVPPTLMPSSPGAAALAAAVRPIAPAGSIACPRCGAATPVGFVYCQACGLHIQAIAPTDPGGAAARAPIPTPLPIPAPIAPAPTAPAPQPNIDPQATTLAPDPRPGAAARAASSNGVAWGTAVLVNRDGSDGDRHTLDAEYTVIGRAGADIAFDEDRFLARLHARLERGGDGVVRVSPTDTLNGVFRKTDASVELVDGTIILVGREVLRYERVDAEERNVTPLIRHGVALFGSPPREPWGRLLQILPSGGHRDIRHLVGEEVVLGREEGDIIFRDDAFMSRRHAAITWDGKRAQLTDLGSSNGTFVRLTAATPVKHGDHLRLGDQLLRIELGR